MAAATVRLTEEQREELGRDLVRLVEVLARALHLPWWAALLLLVGAVAGVFGLAFAREHLLRRASVRQRAEARRIQALQLIAPAAVVEQGVCGHCGRPTASSARIAGRLLCRTGTWPPSSEPRDCYRLVTEHQHHADGSCCRNRDAR
jgi:hypothetical protein